MTSASPFVPGPAVRIAGVPGGPLAGLTFAAKDLFDVAGHPTGGGNPDWARQHAVPTRHAWAVQRLLDAGATLIGKTITDEISLGILGENAFDGTPLNPHAPDRVPGGSSSGSASAVAQRLCDTALGTDTGGSVRVPASFCGLHGIRPTHGRLDLTGMLPQAPSSDTTGWFARDAQTFARVSAVMLGEPIPTALPTRLVVAQDAFGLADEETAARAPADGESPHRADETRPGGRHGAARPHRLGAGPAHAAAVGGVGHLQGVDRPRQPAHGVRRRPQSRARRARSPRASGSGPRWCAPRPAPGSPPSCRAGTILCLPTTPFPAPLRGLPLATLEPLRARITCLAAHGGLAGFPQVSLPGAHVGGLPVGLSILGARGSDATLVAVAQAMEAAR